MRQVRLAHHAQDNAVFLEKNGLPISQKNTLNPGQHSFAYYYQDSVEAGKKQLEIVSARYFSGQQFEYLVVIPDYHYADLAKAKNYGQMDWRSCAIAKICAYLHKRLSHKAFGNIHKIDLASQALLFLRNLTDDRNKISIENRNTWAKLCCNPYAKQGELHTHFLEIDRTLTNEFPEPQNFSVVTRSSCHDLIFSTRIYQTPLAYTLCLRHSAQFGFGANEQYALPKKYLNRHEHTKTEEWYKTPLGTCCNIIENSVYFREIAHTLFDQWAQQTSDNSIQRWVNESTNPRRFFEDLKYLFSLWEKCLDETLSQNDFQTEAQSPTLLQLVETLRKIMGYPGQKKILFSRERGDDHSSLIRYEELLPTGEKQIRICYEVNKKYSPLIVRQIFIKGLYFFELDPLASASDDWQEKAIRLVHAYLYNRLNKELNFYDDPESRFAKIDLTNQALEFLKNLPKNPDNISIEQRNAWANLCKNNYATSGELYESLLKIDELLAGIFPELRQFAWIAPLSPKQALSLRISESGSVSLFLCNSQRLQFGNGQELIIPQTRWETIRNASSLAPDSENDLEMKENISSQHKNWLLTYLHDVICGSKKLSNANPAVIEQRFTAIQFALALLGKLDEGKNLTPKELTLAGNDAIQGILTNIRADLLQAAAETATSSPAELQRANP